MADTVPSTLGVGETIRRISASGVTGPRKAALDRAALKRLWVHWGGPTAVEHFDTFNTWATQAEKRAEWLSARSLDPATMGADGGSQDLQAARLSAGKATRQVLLSGLASREGRFLVPPAILSERANDDLLACSLLHGVGAFLAGKRSAAELDLGGYVVCRGCCLVFRPKVRSHGTVYCSVLCAKRPAAPPLGGSRSLEFRVPVLTGDVVTAWRRRRVTTCCNPDCGKAFVAARADARTCSPSCRQRVARARR